MVFCIQRKYQPYHCAFLLPMKRIPKIYSLASEPLDEEAAVRDATLVPFINTGSPLLRMKLEIIL